MLDFEAQLLEQDAGWRQVLEAYRPPEEIRGKGAGEGAEKDAGTGAGTGAGEDVGEDVGEDAGSFEEQAGESTGWEPSVVAGPEASDQAGEFLAEDDWLPRVSSLEGLDDESLSRLHGRLIALGWLGFEVAGRSTGIRYRITRDGQRVLDGLVPVPTLRVVASDD